MLRQLGIRTRLTALVTIVFTAATVVGGFAIMNLVEQRLVADTRMSAQNVLGGYLHTASAGGGPVIAIVDPSEAAAFFYLDGDGNELTQQQYVDFMIARLPGDAPADPRTIQVQIEALPNGVGTAAPAPDQGPGQGPTVVQGGFALAVRVTSIGQIRTVDRGDEVVAVAQRVRFPDGTELQIGVTSPLQPVRDSMRAIRTLLWIAAPALIAIVGTLTAMTVGRAMRPVHSITHRTRAISDTNLSERVPVPTGGDDITELAVTMNDMLSRLESGQRRHRQFIADASHELRSPVAASRAQLEVALAHPEQADWNTTAATVLAEQTRLGHLVDDLLALSRMDEQGLGTIARVDLGELVLAELQRPHRVKTSGVVDRPVCVVGNRAHLTRALRNVVDNADRHATSRVSVNVSQVDGCAVIHVDDDGPGIPVNDRLRVFDRFTRLDEPRTRNDGGAGLGLAIVSRVATTHGGRVFCTDAPEGGARITISIPVG
jgi:signal transduction histidine kinase